MLLRKKRSQPVYSFESGPDAEHFELPEPIETSLNPEEYCIQNALENELAQAVQYLPHGLRVAIQIRYREYAPVAQIAKMFGISEAAAKSGLSRARSQIRRHLEKHERLRCGIDSGH
jgi:RNA polymerase sigma factor (sigma-70 family)